MPELQAGNLAPDFTLPKDDGTVFRLAQQFGQPVVLFFYPADDTPGCTTQNVAFSTLLPQFESLGTVVLGISPDSVAQHQSFRAKHALTVELASDPDHHAISAYGVWRLKKNY